jgi:hypothetical protein
MPIFRYFIFVGGALLALLFLVNQTLSPEPVKQAAQASVATASEQPVVRIRSDRKLPERVVFDTNQPTIAAPVIKTATVTAPADAAASPALADASAKARVRETFAQLVPDPKNAASAKSAEAKSAEAKSAEAKSAEARPAEAKPAAPVHHKRKVARSRAAPQYSYGYGRPMLVAQQPHFGLFDTW